MWLRRLRQILLLIPTLALACGPGLPDMRRLDALVTSAEQACKRQAAEPKTAKLSVCRRALACIEPAKKAQHAVQDMLLTMAKMEDSADDRLVAAAGYHGAVAACGIAGFTEGAAKGKEAAKGVEVANAPQNAANAIVDRVAVSETAATKPVAEVAPPVAPAAPAPATQPTNIPSAPTP